MTGYVAGDGGVTGISAHSSPTRQSNFAWTHASRYTIIQGAMREPDKFGQRQLWVCGFGPFFFGGGGGAGANIWSIHGNTEREHQMDELGA